MMILGTIFVAVGILASTVGPLEAPLNLTVSNPYVYTGRGVYYGPCIHFVVNGLDRGPGPVKVRRKEVIDVDFSRVVPDIGVCPTDKVRQWSAEAVPDKD